MILRNPFGSKSTLKLTVNGPSLYWNCPLSGVFASPSGSLAGAGLDSLAILKTANFVPLGVYLVFAYQLLDLHFDLCL